MRIYLNFLILIQSIFFFVASCFAETIESYDCMGNLTVAHYNSQEQLQSIESYSKSSDGDVQLVNIERFEWHPLHMHSLVERTLEDSQGNLLISQSSFYDDQGQLIEEHFLNHIEESNSTIHSYEYCEDGSRIRTITIENELPPAFCITSKATTNNWREDLTSYLPPFEHTIHEEKEFFFRMSGCYTDPAETATFHGREIDDKVRITFVNGILNTKSDFLKTVQWISDQHGGVSIHYTFKPTEGWAWDILRSSLAKLGIVSPEAYSIAQTWKKLIAEMGGTESGGTIIHYAHSIGGTNTYIAKSLMTPEELKMIQVYTFGSPTIIPQGEFQSIVNYISVRDWIGLIDFKSRINALFSDDSHILFVGTYWGIPFPEHYIDCESYRVLLENFGNAFVKQYFRDPSCL